MSHDVFHTEHKAESMVSVLCEPQLRNTCGKYVRRGLVDVSQRK